MWVEPYHKHHERGCFGVLSLRDVFATIYIYILYTKPTDTHNYLHSKSSHPRHLKDSLPYSQALRLNRICSQKNELDIQCEKLKQQFIKRGYHLKEVHDQINKAVTLKREDTLKLTKHDKNNTNRIPFITTFNSTLPPITEIIHKGQHSVTRANHGAQPYTERNSTTYAKESLPSREAPILTEPRTYAEILKPRFNNRKNRPIAGNTTHNGNQSDRISRGIPNTDVPPQPQGNGYTNYKTSKNLTSPRPTEVEGGIQQLLANTSEAFKLLQNNFEKLVVLQMTQMEK